MAGAVAGVVLAAGTSTRMGRNKLLLELAGESLVRRTVRTAAAAGLDPVLVVLGHEAERVEAEILGLPCHTVLNPDYRLGIGSSLRVGAARAAEAAEALVVLLADMPFVDAGLVARVLARHREDGAPLVVVRYGEREAPPTLFGRALYGELLATPDGEGGRPVVDRHRVEAVFVDAPGEALRDVDRPADLALLERPAQG